MTQKWVETSRRHLISFPVLLVSFAAAAGRPDHIMVSGMDFAKNRFALHVKGTVMLCNDSL